MAASLPGQTPRDAAPERSAFDVQVEDSKPPPARDVTPKLDACSDAAADQLKAVSEGAFLALSGMVADSMARLKSD